MTIRVFLSASIPLMERDPKYWKTANNMAIRESIKALVVELAFANGQLIFGGHPAITPLISFMHRQMGLPTEGRVKLYQSREFEAEFPKLNADFPDLVVTPRGDSEEASKYEMRRQIITENDLSCAFFIGGMKGVLAEYDLLAHLKPEVKRYPIASTGAAAAIAYEQPFDHDSALKTERTYSTLFRRLLSQHV